MKIIKRDAENDFYALLAAQGMENAGANVFSITTKNNSSIFKYSVWCKVENESMKIDHEIDLEFEKLKMERY